MAKKQEYDIIKFNDAKVPSELQWIVDNPEELRNILCQRVRSKWDQEYRCCRKEDIKCDDCILDTKHNLEFKEWITPNFEDNDTVDKIK